jgi:hypothetical protein
VSPIKRDLTVIRAAERHRELVTHLATERTTYPAGRESSLARTAAAAPHNRDRRSREAVGGHPLAAAILRNEANALITNLGQPQVTTVTGVGAKRTTAVGYSGSFCLTLPISAQGSVLRYFFELRSVNWLPDVVRASASHDSGIESGAPARARVE